MASWLREFASKASVVAESLHALSTSLLSLKSSLRFVAHQVQAGRLVDDVVDALKSVITSVSTQVSVLRTRLF